MENATVNLQNRVFDAQKAEKKEIKSVSNKTGFAMLGNFIIMITWSFFYMRICGWFGISTTKALRLVNDAFMGEVIQLFVSVLMSLVPALILCRACLKKPSAVAAFGKPKCKIGLIVAMSVGFCLFVSLLTNIAGSIFEQMGFHAPEVSIEMPEGIWGFFMSVLTVACVPALVEEFAMRGIVLGLFRRFGDGFAVLVSAFMFAIMHASVNQIPFAFFVGLALGLATVNTGSVWTAVLIHFFNNFISVAVEYTGIFLGEDMQSYIYLAILASMLIILILCWTGLTKMQPEYFRFKPAQTAASEKKKFIWFVFSPVVLIATAASFCIAYFLR